MNSYEQELAEVAKKHGMQHPVERASIFMLHLLDQLKNAGVNVTPIGEPDGTLPNFKIEIPALTRTRARTKALHAALHVAGVNVNWDGFMRRWHVGVQKDPSLGHLIKRLIELDVKVDAVGGTDKWHVVLPEPAYATYWQQLCNALKAAKVEVVFEMR